MRLDHGRNPLRRKRYGALLTALVLLAAGLPAATAAAAPTPERTPDADERALIAEAEEAGPQRVIVELHGEVAARSDRDPVQQQRADGANLTQEHRFEHFPLVTVTADADAVRGLATSPDVAKVYPTEVRTHALAETVPLIGADEVHARGTDGSGQTIVVIDDGIDAEHEFVAGRLVAEACFSGAIGDTLCPNGERQEVGEGAADALTPECEGTASGCVHGTHVAGIALGAATGAAPGDGVAPAADLAAIRVFSREDDEATCAPQEAPCLLADDDDVLRGIDHALAIAEERPVAAVNMSLGGGITSEHCESRYRTPFEALVEAGIAPVVASGNASVDDGVSEPACEPAAVAVGASTENDTAAGFGNRGELLDLFAPGDAVTSSVASASHDDYEEFPGTSMAAPHVAGAFALLRQVDPGASVDELVTLLRDTGEPITYPSGDGEVTTPRIDLAAAIPPPPQAPTTLEYTGPTEADYHDEFTASATLTSQGAAVSGARVSFVLGSGGGSQECAATTDGSGAVSCTLTPTQRPGPTTLTASFAGTDELLPAADTVNFTVTKQETAVAYTGPDKVANGTDVVVSGVLHEEELDGPPVPGRDVTLALGDGEDRQACTGTTDDSGVATCTIAGLDQPLNDDATVPVTVTFDGDAYYEESSASGTVLLEHYTGRAFGLSATIDLPLLPGIGVGPTPDTGAIRTADATTTDTPCTARVSALLVTAATLCPEVTTTLAPGTSTATATVEHVRIGLPGAPVIEIEGATARSVSTCDGDGSAEGSTDLTLRVAGEEVAVDLAPNTVVDVAGGTLRLVLNEQTPVPDADHGLTVNAVHLTSLDGLVDVTVASAESDVHHCAS
jgi:subtilisin family serine protease